MSFFEGACRVPLVIASGRIAPGRVGASVSLLDLLPTLVDLSGGDAQLSRLPSTAALSGPISPAGAATTRRSANISPKAPLRPW